MFAWRGRCPSPAGKSAAAEMKENDSACGLNDLGQVQQGAQLHGVGGIRHGQDPITGFSLQREGWLTGQMRRCGRVIAAISGERGAPSQNLFEAAVSARGAGALHGTVLAQVGW